MPLTLQVIVSDMYQQIVRRVDAERVASSAAGVLVVAVVIIAALAFKLGSGSATSAAGQHDYGGRLGS